VAHRDLAKPWQSFLDELRTSRTYADFIRSLLQVSRFKMRFAWHRGISGSEVSPHRDSSKKIGPHIFYFNTNSDWNIAWGGSTLVLDGKTVDKMNPDFSDFISITPVQFLDNRSLLYKNTRDAWHGAQPLQPPDGQHRCLFNVIYEYPSFQYKAGRLMRKVSRLVDKEQLRRR